MKEQEIWKPVRGYEGYLEVSNFGNIKSLERFVDSGVGGRVVPERIVKLRDRKHRYAIADVTINNKTVTLSVPRLVYETFNEVILDSKKVVINKDGNKFNNKLENISVITRRSMPNVQKSKSGYRGVKKNSKYENKYSAVIHFEGRQMYIHTSEDKEECRKVYELAKAMIDEYDKLKAGILSNSRLNNKLIVKSLPIK